MWWHCLFLIFDVPPNSGDKRLWGEYVDGICGISPVPWSRCGHGALRFRFTGLVGIWVLDYVSCRYSSRENSFLVVPKVTLRRWRDKKPTGELCSPQRGKEERAREGELEIKFSVEKKGADIDVHHRRNMEEYLLLSLFRQLEGVITAIQSEDVLLILFRWARGVYASVLNSGKSWNDVCHWNVLHWKLPILYCNWKLEHVINVLGSIYLKEASRLTNMQCWNQLCHGPLFLREFEGSAVGWRMCSVKQQIFCGQRESSTLDKAIIACQTQAMIKKVLDNTVWMIAWQMNSKILGSFLQWLTPWVYWTLILLQEHYTLASRWRTFTVIIKWRRLAMRNWRAEWGEFVKLPSKCSLSKNDWRHKYESKSATLTWLSANYKHLRKWMLKCGSSKTWLFLNSISNRLNQYRCASLQNFFNCRG